MKRVTILAICFLPPASEKQEHTVLYPGSTVDIDDNAAGLLVVAGKAKHDPEAKLKNTAKDHEAVIDARQQAAAVSPHEASAIALAKALAPEMAKAMVAEMLKAQATKAPAA